MSGHAPWSEVRRRGTPEEEAKIAEEVRSMLRENVLAQLRRRKEITQEELATVLRVAQVRVSSIKHADAPIHRGTGRRTDRAGQD